MSTVITAPGTAAAVPEKASRLTRERVRSAWLFMAPMLIVLALVAGWPLVRTMWFGFTDANLSDLQAAEFVGFVNYYYLLTDPDWWNAVWNTLVFTGGLADPRDHFRHGDRADAERPFSRPRPAARRRADPLGDPDRGLGPDVELDVPRRLRRD